MGSRGGGVMGVQPKPVAGGRWRRCGEGRPTGGGDGGQEVGRDAQVSGLGDWVGGVYHSQASGGRTQCPPWGPESWLAKGVMASPESTLLRLTPSGPNPGLREYWG